MQKLTLILATALILTLTACGTSNAANPASAAQNGTTAGELPAPTQIALGTLKLDATENAVTAEQAGKLIPLWETLQVLYNSDTAANQEIEALNTQIKETMTEEQMQAITAMKLTRQDMFSVMQAQGAGLGDGQQNRNIQQSGNSSNNQGAGQGGFGPGAGGPPPDERFLSGGGQSQNLSAEQIATAQAARQTGAGNRIPSPLINALIQFLKQKSGS